MSDTCQECGSEQGQPIEDLDRVAGVKAPGYTGRSYDGCNTYMQGDLYERARASKQNPSVVLCESCYEELIESMDTYDFINWNVY